MSDKYNAIMDNDYFSNNKKYWRVEIQTNDINVLNNICSALNLIRDKENE